MAKSDDPKPWDPSQPLEDEEDEKEVQRRARATARLDFVREELSKKKKSGGSPDKKSSLW